MASVWGPAYAQKTVMKVIEDSVIFRFRPPFRGTASLKTAQQRCSVGMRNHVRRHTFVPTLPSKTKNRVETRWGVYKFTHMPCDLCPGYAPKL